MTFEVYKTGPAEWSWRLTREDAPYVQRLDEFASEQIARADIAAFKRSCAGRGLRFVKTVSV